jgi:hypothetical protein
MKDVAADVFLNPHELEHLERDAALPGLKSLGEDAHNTGRYQHRIEELEARVEQLRMRLDKARTCCEGCTST